MYEDTIDGWSRHVPEASDPNHPANTDPDIPWTGAWSPNEKGEVLTVTIKAREAEALTETEIAAREAEAVSGGWTPSWANGLGRHPNSARFHEILGQLGDLHDKKQADYGRGDDPFANVRGSEEWGMPAWVGAMVRANDKIRRLQQYARTGSLANEGVEDAFMDLAVYAIIAMVLWEEDK